MTPAYLRGPHSRNSHNSGRDRWMVSYLDVLTILLILFVAMAAKTLHSESTPPPPPAPAAQPQPRPETPAKPALLVELEQRHLEVRLDPRGIVVSLPQELLFAAGQDHINADALPTVSALAETLSKIPNSVILIGHTDAAPIHNQRFRSNWDLAAARSLRLLELLSTEYGIDEARLSVESHGSYDPKTSNDTPTGRASNRRVEIVILNPTASTLQVAEE